MAENLNYTNVGRIGKCYDNKPSNCEICGRLYDWETAKEVCPKGWHLPSHDEWDTLYQSIGGEYYYSYYEEDIKLKAKNGWTEENGTDNYGFTALPCGFSMCKPIYDKINMDKIVDCVYDSRMLGYKGIWWTATKDEDNGIRSWIINRVSDYSHNEMWLMSVRCVKDSF